MLKQLQHSILFIFLLFVTTTSFAQNTTTITGKIVETNNGGPIEFATVLVGDPTNQKPIVGTTTLQDGSFTLETTASEFYIEVSFIA